MAAQPTGTVTMLFSDVEGSTELLGRLGAERYAEVLEQHNRLLREAFALYSGYEVDTAGDSFFVTFGRAGDAVSAAGEAQRLLATSAWPDSVSVRVRMALHTGEPLLVGTKYVGMDVHRAARVMAAAHGGQVLVSETTASLLDGVPLRDLGLHRLKDLLSPIRLHQLLLEGLPDVFPPPRSLHRTNLPTAAWPLLGREPELDRIRALIAGGARLVTLTGPGGVGKTRLALQAAAELVDEFPDGVYFVPLAPLRNAAMVKATIADVVGLQPDDDLVSALQSRRMLVVLDNLEHLQGVAQVVAEVLVGETLAVATSRTPLRLGGEREFVVEPLANDAAIELFVSRAAASGREVAVDETVAAVCRRLDNLPLALELAAARAKLLSPSALMKRLDSALPLLTGGGTDRPQRQQTLRATIEWSHDLLDPEAQAAFRQLSVFRGPFTLEAAEEVTGAGLDVCAGLVDHSLIKPIGDDRFFLLETIREYARERLDDAGETGEVTLRHAQHYLEQLLERKRHIFGPRRAALLAWFGDEEDNFRAALDRLELASFEEAARMANLLAAFWSPRGQLREARQRVTKILASENIAPGTQARLLQDLAEFEERLGEHEAARSASTEALALAEAAGDAETVGYALYMLASLATMRGDFSVAADLLARALAEGCTDTWTRALFYSGLAETHAYAGRVDDAREAFGTARAGFKASGDEANDVACAIGEAELELDAGDFDAAAAIAESVLEWTRRTGDHYRGGGALSVLGSAELGRGRRPAARAAMAEALDLVVGAERTGSQIFATLLTWIAFAAEPGSKVSAVRLLEAADRLRKERGFVLSSREYLLEEQFRRPLGDETGSEPMTLEDTIALAKKLLKGWCSLTDNAILLAHASFQRRLRHGFAIPGNP